MYTYPYTHTYIIIIYIYTYIYICIHTYELPRYNASFATGGLHCFEVHFELVILAGLGGLRKIGEEKRPNI